MLCKYQSSLEVQLMESQALWMGRDHITICSGSLPDAQNPDCLSGMMMRQVALLTLGQCLNFSRNLPVTASSLLSSCTPGSHKD